MANSVSSIAGSYVRILRRRNGWTVQALAERCAEVGAPHLTAAAITNIELCRRGRAITVDELFDLATAFKVKPQELLPGIVADTPEGLVKVTPEEFGILQSVFTQVLTLCRPS